MRVNMDNVEKTTPSGWVVWADINKPHIKENILGIIVQGKDSRCFYGYAKFGGKEYAQPRTVTLKGAVKLILKALDGLS
jgi:hypothetical protein